MQHRPASRAHAKGGTAGHQHPMAWTASPRPGPEGLTCQRDRPHPYNSTRQPYPAQTITGQACCHG